MRQGHCPGLAEVQQVADTQQTRARLHRGQRGQRERARSGSAAAGTRTELPGNKTHPVPAPVFPARYLEPDCSTALAACCQHSWLPAMHGVIDMFGFSSIVCICFHAFGMAMRSEGRSELCSRVIHRLWPECRVQAASCCSPGPLESRVNDSPSSSLPQKAPGSEYEKSAQRSRALSSTDRHGSGVKARGKTELPVCLLPLGTHPCPAFYIPLPGSAAWVSRMSSAPAPGAPGGPSRDPAGPRAAGVELLPARGIPNL